MKIHTTKLLFTGLAAALALAAPSLGWAAVGNHLLSLTSIISSLKLQCHPSASRYRQRRCGALTTDSEY